MAIQFAGAQAGIIDTFVTGGTIGVGTTLEFANRGTLIIDTFVTFVTIFDCATL